MLKWVSGYDVYVSYSKHSNGWIMGAMISAVPCLEDASDSSLNQPTPILSIFRHINDCYACRNVADALWQSLGSRKSCDSSNIHYSGELSGSIDDDDLELLVLEGNATAVRNCLISTRVDPDRRSQVCPMP